MGTNNVLYSFDYLTGKASAVGPTGVSVACLHQVWSNSLAGVGNSLFYTYQLFDANTGASLDEAQVYKIDPRTGAAKLLGPVGVSPDLPFFGAGSVDGILYGFTVDTSTLVERSTQSTNRRVKPLSLQTWSRALRAFSSAVAVPEPGVSVLAGTGLVMFGLYFRLRTRSKLRRIQPHAPELRS